MTKRFWSRAGNVLIIFVFRLLPACWGFALPHSRQHEQDKPEFKKPTGVNVADFHLLLPRLEQLPRPLPLPPLPPLFQPNGGETHNQTQARRAMPVRNDADQGVLFCFCTGMRILGFLLVTHPLQLAVQLSSRHSFVLAQVKSLNPIGYYACNQGQTILRLRVRQNRILSTFVQKPLWLMASQGEEATLCHMGGKRLVSRTFETGRPGLMPPAKHKTPTPRTGMT